MNVPKMIMDRLLGLLVSYLAVINLDVQAWYLSIACGIITPTAHMAFPLTCMTHTYFTSNT